MRAIVILTFAFAAACASSRGSIPVRQVADTEAAYRSAQAIDADKIPQAALHLQLAREQMELAQKLVNAKEYERAEGALLRARVDAEMATAITQRDKTKKEAETALSQLSKVRNQQNNND